jgi:N-acetyldiaminopimelate deacetylase
MTPDLYQIRRQLHAIPEIAFEEHQTQQAIIKNLKHLKLIEIHLFTGCTGILVEYSHGTGDYLLFRADMDALPVTENTGCEFPSQNPGKMHACGHDIHMTILIGLIHRVVESRCKKNLLFLFQPAEEGKGGAQAVLAENLIQQFPVRHAFACHVSGRLPVGTVSAKPGIFFAIPQEFDAEFTGKSAHAAFPANGIDALKAGVSFYRRMNLYVDSVMMYEKVIFNVGVMTSGTVRNVIPDYCKLEGTHRTLLRQICHNLNDEMQKMGEDIAEQFNVGFRLNLLCSYDPVVNDAQLYDRLKTVCAQSGKHFVESEIFMTGEDFGFFTSLYPSLLFWLGGGELEYDLHSDKFLPDEACIPEGIEVFYQLIVSL